MTYSTLFLLQAGLQLALAAWLYAIYRSSRLVVAAVLLAPQLALVYDNLIVGLGRQIGLGPTLAALSWPRFWLHWLLAPWFVVACGQVLRFAGLAWAATRAAQVAFLAFACALIAHELPHFWRDSLHPVCEFDLVRYSTQLAPARFCFPDQVAVPGGPPYAAVMTCLVVIATGALLLWRRRFPWMLAGGLAMLASATPPLAHYRLDNLGEVLLSGGCIWALARFGGEWQRASSTSRAASLVK